METALSYIVILQCSLFFHYCCGWKWRVFEIFKQQLLLVVLCFRTRINLFSRFIELSTTRLPIATYLLILLDSYYKNPLLYKLQLLHQLRQLIYHLLLLIHLLLVSPRPLHHLHDPLQLPPQPYHLLTLLSPSQPTIPWQLL